MKNRISFRALITLSFSFFFCSSLYAVNRAGAFIMTPSGGIYRYATKRHINHQAMAAISIGYGLSDQWSGEVFVGKISTEEKEGQKRNIDGEVYALNGMYHFRAQKVLQPYLLFGVGAMNLHPHRAEDDSVQANLNGGFGLGYYFSQQLGFRLELRDFYTLVGGKHDVACYFGLSVFLGGKEAVSSQ